MEPSALGLRFPLTGPADSATGPTPRFVGDLWFCTTTANGFTANTLYEYFSGAWSVVVPAIPAFAAPALTLGTANIAGSSAEVLSTDATIAAFDGTTPVSQAFGDAAAAGSAAVAARRDHKHGMPANPVTSAIPQYQNAGDNGRKIQTGHYTGTTALSAASLFTADVSISFGSTFGSTPDVATGPYTTAAQGLEAAGGFAVSTTGFTCRMGGGLANTAVNGSYMAIG